MKLITSYPLHSILLGFILSALLIGFGIVYDMSMLTTIGGLVLGLSIGGVVILYGVLILCISFWR
mgnify:FL=1